jgi:hypothetical protein
VRQVASQLVFSKKKDFSKEKENHPKIKEGSRVESPRRVLALCRGFQGLKRGKQL